MASTDRNELYIVLFRKLSFFKFVSSLGGNESFPNKTCTYSSKGAQNILTILNIKNGSQQIPNITTTDVIILIDFFFLAIKFISLPSSLLPGIKDTKYKVHPWRLSLVSSNIENICLTLCIGMVMVGKLLIQKSRQYGLVLRLWWLCHDCADLF